jgi:hypothetical protein
MRTNVKQPECKRGHDKTEQQLLIENKRAAAIERLKGQSRTKARNRIKKIYRHLPADMSDFITAVFLKYNHGTAGSKI